MDSGSFAEIMELPKQLLYLRAQLGFMEARAANHAEKTNIQNKMQTTNNPVINQI